MKKHIFLSLITFSTSAVVHAQWYFETSVVDSKFSDYDASVQTLNGDETYTNGLENYSGFRDFSYGLGFLIPFSSLENRVSNTFKTPLFRLGLGVAFDKISLNTKAVINNNTSLINKYNFSQLQGRFGIHFTPDILNSKNLIGEGSNQARLTFDFNAGLGYNLFTSATQENSASLINLRKQSNDFDSYLSYFIGTGIHFSISSFAKLYGKYSVENSFNLQENNEFVNERYKLNKTRISFGLILDFRARNRYKDIQQEKTNMAIKTLDGLTNEKGAAQKNNDSNLNQLLATISELEKKLNSKTTQLSNDHNNVVNRLSQLDSITNTYGRNDFSKGNITKIDKITKEPVNSEEDFFFFPQMPHVFFPNNSSYFDTDKYHNPLSNLATYLKQNPNSVLSVIGYADMSGNSDYNSMLSQRRADRIRQYLIKKFDVSPEVIESFGLGQTNLFSKADRKQNRKTQILIKREK